METTHELRACKQKEIPIGIIFFPRPPFDVLFDVSQMGKSTEANLANVRSVDKLFIAYATP